MTQVKPMAKSVKKNSLLVRAEDRLKGIEANKLGGATSLKIGGTTYQVNTATARIQQIVDTIQAAEDAAKARAQAVATKKEEAPKDKQFLADFDAAVIQTVGRDPKVLALYGITVAGPRSKPSAETVVAANAQRAKTRQRRGIMGPKQRAALDNAAPTPETSAAPQNAPGAPGPASAPATPAAPSSNEAPASPPASGTAPAKA